MSCGYQDVFYSSFIDHLRSHGIIRNIGDDCTDFLHDVWPAFSNFLRCTVCDWQTAEMTKFIEHYRTRHPETSGAWGSAANKAACARNETVRDRQSIVQMIEFAQPGFDVFAHGDVIRAKGNAPPTDMRVYLSAVPLKGDYSLRNADNRNVAAVHVHPYPQMPGESINPVARDRGFRYRAVLLTATERPTQAVATMHMSWVPEEDTYTLCANGRQNITVAFSSQFSFSQ